MHKHRMYKIATLLLLVASMVVLGLFTHIRSFYNADVTEHKDCAVVFGAAVAPGGIPTPALYDRTETAVEMYTQHTVDCLILSGADSAYGAHEVDVMRSLALEGGVPIEDLIFDFDGYNTQQTIYNLNRYQSYALVSNDFHLARINMLAQRVGLQGFELQASEYHDAEPENELYWVMREAVALVYYFFATI